MQKNDIQPKILKCAELIMKFNGYNAENIESIDKVFRKAEEQLMFTSFGEFIDEMENSHPSVLFEYNAKTMTMKVGSDNGLNVTKPIYLGVTDFLITEEDRHSAVMTAIYIEMENKK